MSGLVLELQRDALDNTVPITQLLRKALVVSRKLSVKHVIDWLTNELNGYPHGSVIPEYRIISGQVMAFNPFHGWIPIHFPNAEIAKAFKDVFTNQKVGELESLLESKELYLQIRFPEEKAQILRQLIEIDLDVAIHLQRVHVAGILDAARNNVLEFALQLEQEGILGEGLSFTDTEKQSASKVTYNVTNNIGQMNNSQFQQQSSGTQCIYTSDNLENLIAALNAVSNGIQSLGIDDVAQRELLAEISTVKAQAGSPTPKRCIIVESLHSVRTILENVAGNLLASGALVEISKLLGG
jgi:hypothetical protein